MDDRRLLGVVKLLRMPITNAIAEQGGSVLLGFCGAGALVDIAAAELNLDAAPAPGDDPHPWAVCMGQAITGLARDHGLLEDGHLNGNVLIGWGGNVWSVYTEGAHLHTDGIAAIGTGAALALGALHAMTTWPRIVGECEALEDAVAMAVTIASGLDLYSGGPSVVMSIP